MSENPNADNSPPRSYWRRNGMTVALWAMLAFVLLAVNLGWFESPHPLLNQTAPPFSLAKLDGGNVELKQHLGKDVVLLDFFATWCPPCRESLPHLAALTAEFEGKNVAVYAVNVGEDKETVAEFFKEQKLSLPTLLDPDNAVSDAYGVGGIPQQVVIGKDGIARYVGVGFGAGSEGALRDAIEAARAGQ